MTKSLQLWSRFVVQASNTFSPSSSVFSPASSTVACHRSLLTCFRGNFSALHCQSAAPINRGSRALRVASENTTSRNLIRRKSSKMASEKPKVVFVLGAPGSGKGTQCSRIVDTFGYTHLSAGDLLREERARPNSQFGTLIEEYIVNGKIVPVEITCSLIENAMVKTKADSGKNSFLIDGFPRNQDNLDGWNKQMSEKVQMQFVLFFDGPTEVFLERCLKRGAAGSGRSDDNVESLKKRLVTFETETKPIVAHYDKLSLVRSIDATEGVEEVFSKVKKCFDDAANGS